MVASYNNTTITVPHPAIISAYLVPPQKVRTLFELVQTQLELFDLTASRKSVKAQKYPLVYDGANMDHTEPQVILVVEEPERASFRHQVVVVSAGEGREVELFRTDSPMPETFNQALSWSSVITSWERDCELRRIDITHQEFPPAISWADWLHSLKQWQRGFNHRGDDEQLQAYFERVISEIVVLHRELFAQELARLKANARAVEAPSSSEHMRDILTDSRENQSEEAEPEPMLRDTAMETDGQDL